MYCLRGEIAGNAVWCTLMGSVCLRKVSVSRGSTVQSTPDNSNLLGKLKKVRVSGSLSYQEFEANNWK